MSTVLKAFISLTYRFFYSKSALRISKKRISYN